MLNNIGVCVALLVVFLKTTDALFEKGLEFDRDDYPYVYNKYY